MAESMNRSGRVPPEGWTNGPLREVPGVNARQQKILLFGGKGGKRSTSPPSPARLAAITYTGDGRYEVWDLNAREVLLEATLRTRIWWAPAPRKQAPPPAGCEA
jgi:hypothetical protein